MTLAQDPVVIIGATRTPIGSFQGQLKDYSAPQLGAKAIKTLMERAQLTSDQISEVVMGCVLSAGLGQAPARQAAIAAGLPVSIPCSTINKVCGSGLKAIMMAHDTLLADPDSQVIIAGGMESMTNAPYLLAKARAGYRYGHGQLLDHMVLDGLENVYDGRSMGALAEDTAARYGLTRAEQDDYAHLTVTRAQAALASGAFHKEIAPIEVGQDTVTNDEHPSRIKLEKIPLLKPAFSANGTITAAHSSAISDGAAAVAMARLSTARRLGLPIRAILAGGRSHSHEPAHFTTAPIGASQKLLQALSWPTSSIDAWEINEAFAVVPMAAMRDLGLSRERINIHGGACALGHPIGASGARLVVTLLHILEGMCTTTGGCDATQHGDCPPNQAHTAHRGVATACIGGGEAIAVGLELCA